MYLIFENISDFDVWHEEQKTAFGLPVGITTDISSPNLHPSGESICAYVDESLNIEGDYFTEEQVQASGFIQL